MSHRPKILALPAIAVAVVSLASCANSSGGNTLETILAPDPQLQPTPAPEATATPAPQPSPTPDSAEVSLPENFPTDIPEYPNGTLEVVAPLTPPEEGTITRWFSADSATLIRRYYQTELTQNNWKITTPKENNEGNLIAEQNNLQLTLAFAPPKSGETIYTLTYRRQETSATVPKPEEKPEVNSSEEKTTPAPETSPTPAPSESDTSEGSNSDIPEQLAPAAKQVLALKIIQLENKVASLETFEPNRIITRGEYARWLIEVNNLLYQDDPGKQIRLASTSQDSAFQDVPKNNPDFPYIQGLAETGLIPSALSGDATATRFRPDAPLTRENLIAWKVPLDSRSALPKATLDAVKETWGFQDSGKINSQFLPGILADFQNGNNANIRRVFGYTRLLQPQKAVTRAEAAAVLAYFGVQGEVISAEEVAALRGKE
ncbi:S-layer homology domain-containing protein [Roseofilum casamattae]|uniref:S-layer homology domain-containing protein n=1 Tax=Roseofilum casamattae BLCC-M143 TaxID=3022442 RepID=A0ABT7BWT2_9CYAN|nr:S-layer homology domain-containing protein [Roseofilum casamattae]MDJ1183658.1 S-layer homology domain-containing protein [Roseofilum casamattae BLCC-M143]